MCVPVCTDVMNPCHCAEVWKFIEYNEFNFCFFARFNWLNSEKDYKDFLFYQLQDFFETIESLPLIMQKNKMAVQFTFLTDITLYMN